MLRSFLAFTLLILSVGVASAQDPPGRVGRLGYIEGTVSFRLGDKADWAPATVNYPVTSGQSFWTEPNAKAEIQIGPAEVRLDQASQLDVVRLDDTTIELRLEQGVLNLHLWQMPGGGISVLTPRGRVVLTVLGSYDIDVGRPSGDVPADRVQVTVLEGAARFEGEHGAVEIGHSEAAIISGEPMNVTLAAAANTPFDDWALARERRETAAQQPGYVAPSVTGYEDLSEYGSWSHDANYGGVWYPTTVPADWAPYRFGHWAFVPPWGWTWIDDAPWGFAPFHYGRWVENDDRWGWVPGALAEQPVYAPALVAFIGGDGWGVNLEGGAAVAAVGWVALAPNEAYRPYYRTSQTYVRAVNGANVSRTATSNNARAGNFRNQQAATVVPATAFTRAAPVQHATVAVPQAQLAQAAVAPSIAHLQPAAAARIGRAVPAAAASSVPRPNVPATIARTRVAATPPPALAAEPAPTAPGPPPKSGARGNAASPPAAAAPAPPQRQQTQTQPAPTAQPPSHPAPPHEAVQRAPPATAAPTAPAPQAAVAPPRVSAPASTPPRAAAAPPSPQPQVQPVRAAPPPIQVVHPEQQTHIAPTPQAWTRVPGPPPAPPAQRAPPPAAAAAPHPAPPPQPAHAAPPPAKGPPAKDDKHDQH